MSRRSLKRHWTTEETDLALEILCAVERSDGRLIGLRQVTRALWGVPAAFSPSKVDRIGDVMPLAVKLAPELFPGHVLARTRANEYVLTNRPTTAMRLAAFDRTKGAVTKLQRVTNELLPNDPESMVFRGLVEGALTVLNPEHPVWRMIGNPHSTD